MVAKREGVTDQHYYNTLLILTNATNKLLSTEELDFPSPTTSDTHAVIEIQETKLRKYREMFEVLSPEKSRQVRYQVSGGGGGGESASLVGKQYT